MKCTVPYSLMEKINYSIYSMHDLLLWEWDYLFIFLILLSILPLGLICPLELVKNGKMLLLV